MIAPEIEILRVAVVRQSAHSEKCASLEHEPLGLPLDFAAGESRHDAVLDTVPYGLVLVFPAPHRSNCSTKSWGCSQHHRTRYLVSRNSGSSGTRGWA